MSNIENSRKDLHISGYVHPTTNNTTNTNPYKTLNTESKKDDYATTRKKSAYATFTTKEVGETIIKGCPDCGGEALYECDCELKDKQCSNGHVWYVNKSGHIKRGDPHDDIS